MQIVGLCLLFFLAVPSSHSQAQGQISGIVVDESGVPAKHIGVEAFPLDMGWDGRLPNSATDEQGRFVILVPVALQQSQGLRWRVYPHQEDQYYADVSELFYQTDNDTGEIAKLEKPDLKATVRLRLGRKAGAIRATVTDIRTGAPLLTPIESKAAWAAEPSKSLHMYHFDGHTVTLLLPSNVDVTLTVSSPGYQPWIYPGTINVGPGQDLPLDIQLQPANLQPTTPSDLGRDER